VTLHLRLFFSPSKFVTPQGCILASSWRCLFPFLRSIILWAYIQTSFQNLFLLFSKIYILWALHLNFAKNN
jgi:hypothetical protein